MSLGRFERSVHTRKVSANCKISSVHDFVKVIPNHAPEIREIDDVENEALVSAFLGAMVDPKHEFTPTLRGIHGGTFEGCASSADKYLECDDVVFPTTGMADAIVIISNEIDMLSVSEKVGALNRTDAQAFVEEVWQMMRTVVRLSVEYSFMHNDLHAKNIVLNKANCSLYLIDFGRSVIDLELMKAWPRSQPILDDLAKITGFATTPEDVRNRVGAETCLHWIPEPDNMPEKCLWVADICMLAMNILQTHLRSTSGTLKLPFASFFLVKETKSPYGKTYETPVDEIRFKMGTGISTSADILQSATRFLESGGNMTDAVESAVVSVTLVGAAIAAIMFVSAPKNKRKSRLFFGESSQIDQAPDLSDADLFGVEKLWELASSKADSWQSNTVGGSAFPSTGMGMLSMYFPSSLAEAYSTKPAIARDQHAV